MSHVVFSLRLLHPASWPVWFGFFLLRLYGLLPWRLTLALGRALGGMLYHLAPSRRRVASTNVQLCFPELDAKTQQHIVRKHLVALGRSIGESVISWWKSERVLAPMAHIDGMENLQAGLARGHGVILLGAHFTAMDIGVRLLMNAIDTPIHTTHQPHTHPVVEYFFARVRGRHAGSTITHRDVRGMLRVFRKNEILWYAPDQGYGGKNSALVPFFGVPAATHTAVRRLADMSKVAVVPFYTREIGVGHYQLTLYPPFDNYPSNDAVADIRRHLEIIEKEVRLAPEQYLWVHKRFKDRGPELPNVYETRRPRD